MEKLNHWNDGRTKEWMSNLTHLEINGSTTNLTHPFLLRHIHLNDETPFVITLFFHSILLFPIILLLCLLVFIAFPLLPTVPGSFEQHRQSSMLQASSDRPLFQANELQELWNAFAQKTVAREVVGAKHRMASRLKIDLVHASNPFSSQIRSFRKTEEGDARCLGPVPALRSTTRFHHGSAKTKFGKERCITHFFKSIKQN